jgi:hypothetical protein
MKTRYAAGGALLGIGIGIIVIFFFPELLEGSFFYMQTTNNALGKPALAPVSASLSLFPFIMGGMCAFLGWLVAIIISFIVSIRKRK